MHGNQCHGQDWSICKALKNSKETNNLFQFHARIKRGWRCWFSHRHAKSQPVTTAYWLRDQLSRLTLWTTRGISEYEVSHPSFTQQTLSDLHWTPTERDREESGNSIDSTVTILQCVLTDRQTLRYRLSDTPTQSSSSLGQGRLKFFPLLWWWLCAAFTWGESVGIFTQTRW